MPLISFKFLPYNWAVMYLGTLSESLMHSDMKRHSKLIMDV